MTALLEVVVSLTWPEWLAGIAALVGAFLAGAWWHHATTCRDRDRDDGEGRR